MPTPEQVARHLCELVRADEANWRDAVALTSAPVPPDADDALVATSTKLGGRYALPAGTEPPRNRDGEEMALLAQVDFASLPRIEGFPTQGLLQVFLTLDDAYGRWDASDPFEQDGWRVRWLPGPVDPVGMRVGRCPWGEGAVSPLEGDDPEWLLTGRPERRLVNVRDFRFPAALERAARRLGPLERLCLGRHGQKVRELVEDALWSTNDVQVGGYPAFAQDDLREEGSRLGRCTETLLSVDSVDGVSMWGDMGVANFLTSAEDLAAGRLDRVAYLWDCG